MVLSTSLEFRRRVDASEAVTTIISDRVVEVGGGKGSIVGRQFMIRID